MICFKCPICKRTKPVAQMTFDKNEETGLPKRVCKIPCASPHLTADDAVVIATAIDNPTFTLRQAAEKAGYRIVDSSFTKGANQRSADSAPSRGRCS